MQQKLPSHRSLPGKNPAFAQPLRWPLLLCFLSLLGVPLGQGASTTLTIPGAIKLTITPPEAVADGAGWLVDGGLPQASGTSVTNLSAGNHSLLFRDLAGWKEPESKQVRVVGGRLQEITAAYRRLPQFYFRAIPSQSVKVGDTLELLVQTNDPSDPENPGPGAILQLRATPSPVGSLGFSASTGRFAYSPASADRLPFTVTFTTSQGVEGKFEISPINPRALEDEVIELQPPKPLDPTVPDEETRNYIQITETRNPASIFNDLTNETVNVTLSGKTLVFEAGHPNHLYEEYNTNRLNLREIRLYADKVVFRSPVIWHQTKVSIQARELRFERNGRLETTPVPRGRRPLGASFFDDDLKVGRDGDPGHDGGDVDVLVEQFVSDGTTPTRFILNGGDGGFAGQGRNGQAEADLPMKTNTWTKLMIRAGNQICATDGPAVMLFQQRVKFSEDGEDVITSTCGDRVPARGENAVRSGVPGVGGRGGKLRSTLNLTAHLRSNGGLAGARGADYVGGLLSSRPFVYRVITSGLFNGKIQTSTKDTPALKVQGLNATAPSGTNGANGTLTLETNAGSWVSSFALRHILQFAKDLYLGGRVLEARQILGEYQTLLSAYDLDQPIADDLSDAAFSERINRDQLMAETELVTHRIDSNLDYFGNPAGWVPMLSFEANLIAFQNEVHQSIPILYLSYWLLNTATNVEARLAAANNALAGLAAENARLLNDFNTAQLALPGLRSEAEVITIRIAGLRQRLAFKLTELESRARENVKESHKLPFWKKALGVISVVADLIPVGQPTVGRIGSGLGLLAKVDPEKPLESAKNLGPDAFGVMTNKNINLCFGTNAPATTSTNSASSTNDVKKAKKDLLKLSTECTKFLGAEFKELAGVFKEAQVDEKELAAELEKLKASDTVFQELVAEVETLNTQKAQFVEQLNSVLQIIGTLDSSLAENAIAANELESQLSSGFAALDHTALLHIAEMERRAMERLLLYQYFVAKSFHYRQLTPFDGNLQLKRLFDRFKVLVEEGQSHVLSAEQFASLEALFTNELREIVFKMLDNINAPDVSLTQPFRLTPSELEQLNRDGRVVVNLSRLGLLTLTKENIRIADWRTKSMSVQPVGGVLGRSAVVGVNYEHSGVSRLTSAGRTFLFRHYTAQTVNPIVWHTIFNARDGSMNNSELSPAQKSLLSVLLDGESNVSDKLLFFSQPAAMADVVITKEVATDNGIDLAITDLEFEVDLDFDNTSSARRELEVAVSDHLTPLIAVSRVDQNGRQDGLGDFTRQFAPFTQVTLEAPARFGELQFDHWVIIGQPAATSSTQVSLTLTSDIRALAVFKPGTPLLVLTPTPVAPSSGLIGFSFPTVAGARYVLEQTLSLKTPAWTAFESRTGDGTPVQFTRQVGVNKAVFFRVRVE